jgi:tetratricopeptide (TPR) repeat protein
MRRAIVVGMLMLAATASPARAQAYREYRAERGNAGTIRGPLADFWFKVRSEWGGYLQTSPGPPPEGGPLDQDTLLTPPPLRVWVSLVYGDRLGRRNEGPLSVLYTEFLEAFKRAESRNWPYAQIFGRPWGKMSGVGRRQNIIMIGTPWELPPVGPLAASLGITVEKGLIQIGERRYRGDNLILVFIAPNPGNPEKYALVITGTGDETLLQAGNLPYGETDYVLFRGERLLESGDFRKIPAALTPAGEAPASWGAPAGWSAHGSHGGFSIRQSKHYTLWHETGRLDRDQVEAIVEEKEGAWKDLVARVGGPKDPRPITWYLYPSVDRKIDETAREEAAHVDLPAGEVHAVFSPTQNVLEPYLDLQVLLHRAHGPTRVPRLERALAIAMAPHFQGQEVPALAARALEQARLEQVSLLRSINEQNLLAPSDGTPTSLDVLLAGFMRHLMETRGREETIAFVASASPRDISGSFRAVFDEDLPRAVSAYVAALDARAAAPPPMRRARADRDAAAADGMWRFPEEARSLMRLRRDDDAAAEAERVLARDPDHAGALTALARLRFRNGAFDDAERCARRALDLCAGAGRGEDCAEIEAWSRLTLGRLEALRERHVAAQVELEHPTVTGGPAPVPTLAAYWLETMGLSRNQLTVVSHLKLEARVALRRLAWADAERDLRKALEIDPTDGEAHRLLSEVYHKQHEYWAWMTRYLNAAHPDYNVIGRIFLPESNAPFVTRVEALHSLDSYNDLVLKGNLELLKAQTLYAAEIQNLHAEGDRVLLEQRDIAGALGIYRRALELNPDFFLSHFLVGRCYFLLDRLDAARVSFGEVLYSRPSDALLLAWTHTYLGYIALEQDDLKGARRAFRQALQAVADGKVATLAREGLDRIETILLLQPDGPGGSTSSRSRP